MRARLSPLSSCHQQPLLLQRSRAEPGKAAGRRSSPQLAPPARGASRGPPLAASALRAPRPPLGFGFPRSSSELVLHARRPPLSPELQATSRFPPRLSVTAHIRGSLLSPCCRFPGPFTKGNCLDRCLCVRGKMPSSSAPCSCNRGRCSGARLGGRGGGGPRSSPPTPALRSLPPSSSGVGEVRLGAAGRGGRSSASSAGRPGLGRLLKARLMGSWEQPGNPAFCNQGETGGTCPAIWSRRGERGRERASPS